MPALPKPCIAGGWATDMGKPCKWCLAFTTTSLSGKFLANNGYNRRTYKNFGLPRHDEKLPQIFVASYLLIRRLSRRTYPLITKNPLLWWRWPRGSLGLPFATCLRMSDVGYVSAAQENLDISYNSIEAYCKALTPGLKETYGPYQRFKPIKGNYQQLNDAILQIENEFYSNIRPKRTSSSNRRPIHALRENGIEYLEVRCIDLDPFEAGGISAEACYFIDTFLLACAISKSPIDSPKELSSIDKNQKLVAETEETNNCDLVKMEDPAFFQEYAKDVLDACSAAAEILDNANKTRAYSRSFQKRFAQTREPETTLSSQLLDSIRKNGSFIDFSLDLASQHLQTL